MISSKPFAKIDLPTEDQLRRLFELKYDVQRMGWDPRMRRRFGYYSPDDWYEALVARLVTEGSKWLDVGCGRNLFPSNRALAEKLSKLAGLLVGVDPDPTIEENPYVHEKINVAMEGYETNRIFDLVTMRMVAEHVTNPVRLVEALTGCTAGGSRVVIYTVNRWSPVPIITHLLPFSLHQPLKRLFWNTESKDTFPTAFRMNTRRTLHKFMAAGGFEEVLFTKVDDCRALSFFRPLLFAELSLQKLLHSVGITYPENCLLAVYRRVDEAQN